MKEKKEVSPQYTEMRESSPRKHLKLLSEANGLTLLRDEAAGKVYAVRDNGITFSLQEL